MSEIEMKKIHQMDTEIIKDLYDRLDKIVELVHEYNKGKYTYMILENGTTVNFKDANSIINYLEEILDAE